MKNLDFLNITPTKFKSTFIIPFDFSNSTENESQYEKVLAKLNKSEKWKHFSSTSSYTYTTDQEKKSIWEPDIFSQVLNSIYNDSSTNINNISNIGSVWVDENNSFSIKLTYNSEKFNYNNKGQLKCFDVNLKNIRLYIFKNGISFFVFDLFDLDDKTELTLKDIIAFQSSFKDISFYLRTNKLSYTYTDKNNQPISYRFVTGVWVASIISELFDNIVYFPQRINPYKNTNYNDDTQNIPQEFKNINIIPDKTIIYNYLTIKNSCSNNQILTKEKLAYIAYLLTNGFNTNYDVRLDVENKMLRTFENTFWYSSNYGCGQYVIYDKNFFIENIMSTRMFCDYFFLYILTLYQHYSLIHYSEKLDKSTEIDNNNLQYKKILETSKEINSFLVKSVYSTVSHLDQQNEVYRYITNSIRIKENIQGLTIGLESLNKILRYQSNNEDAIRDQKTQRGLGCLSILIITSSLTDCYSLISNDFSDFFKNIGLFDYQSYDDIKHWVAFFIMILIFIIFIKGILGLLNFSSNKKN